ncbi:nicotinate (nicotinamide) nucleotide adenylyltransferase [Candidatus Pacearchaeota archaeon]|nr:nicotinate (nicotinamide) nucleotide adenylyltransferase [Candidatus Pacearchaeota archaeon]
MKTNKKIALFGGSFNPIHSQHIKIIEKVIQSKVVDEFWVIPCKKHAFNKDFAPAKNRVDMINLALKNIKQAKVCTVELDSSKTSYTIDTIKILQKKYPNNEFFWVIGSDILHEIHKWQGYKKLLKIISFIILKRDTYPIISINSMNVESIIKIKTNNFSSTEVRENVKKGQSLKKLLPNSIIDYIQKNNLYKKEDKP